MIGLEHSLSPTEQAKLLTRSALRLGITAATFDCVARDLHRLEIGFYQSWLTYVNELPPYATHPIPFDMWRAKAITALLEQEEKS
jgi:hypothetical protein